MVQTAKQLVSGFLRMLYPDRCALCDVIGASSPCASCLSDMVRIEVPFQNDLTEPFQYHITLFRYEGRAAQAVRLLKYRRQTSLVDWMATELRNAYNTYELNVDAIVPVPIHWRREAERGFNQAELLCEKMPKGLVVSRDLIRIRATKTQVGLSLEERLTNLDGAFVASEAVRHKRVLVVDDVMTSGQTARTCAQELLMAGAEEVGILAFAGNVDIHIGASSVELT